MQDIRIEEVMTKDLHTVNHDDVVADVVQLFADQSIHHVLVLNKDDELEGVISSIDLERSRSGISFFRNPRKEEIDSTILRATRVCDIMTKDVITLNASDSIRSAYQVFKKNKFHAIPIMSRGTLVGIVTPMDILDHFFNETAV